MDDKVILSTHADAKKVLDALMDVMNRWKFVSVSDLHDLVGLPNTYKNTEWGWTSLVNIEIQPVENGFALNLPKPTLLS